MTDGMAAGESAERASTASLWHPLRIWQRLTRMPTRLLLGSALLISTWIRWAAAAAAVIGAQRETGGLGVFRPGSAESSAEYFRDATRNLRAMFAPIAQSSYLLLLSVVVLATVGGPLRWRRSIFASSMLVIVVAIPGSWPRTSGANVSTLLALVLLRAMNLLLAVAVAVIAFREIRTFGLTDGSTDGDTGHDDE